MSSGQDPASTPASSRSWLWITPGAWSGPGHARLRPGAEDLRPRLDRGNDPAGEPQAGPRITALAVGVHDALPFPLSGDGQPDAEGCLAAVLDRHGQDDADEVAQPG